MEEEELVFEFPVQCFLNVRLSTNLDLLFLSLPISQAIISWQLKIGVTYTEVSSVKKEED